MSTLIPQQNYIGLGFSILGLALVAPSSYFFRIPNRVLDYLQFCYVFAAVYATSTSGPVFSTYLSRSWIDFMPSFLNSQCTTGDFVCTYGGLISWTIGVIGALILLFIIVKIIACRKPSVTYQPVYNFFKGFFRWSMGPLVYYSVTTIVVQLNTKIMDKSFYAAVIVLAFFVLLSFAEVIGYKCIQRQNENIWKKWIEFSSEWRMGTIMALVSLSVNSNSLIKYFVYGPMVIYAIVYTIKYKFHFRVFERVLFLLGQAILFTLFSLFLFNPAMIYVNYLDFFGLSILIGIEIVVFISKLCKRCKSGDDEDSITPEVNPEDSRRKLDKSGTFIADLNDSLPESPSKADLNDGRGANRRRR